MEQVEYSETSAYKVQTPGNYPEDSTQHSEQGESLKSRLLKLFLNIFELVTCSNLAHETKECLNNFSTVTKHRSRTGSFHASDICVLNITALG